MRSKDTASLQIWLSHDNLRKYGGEHETPCVVNGLFVVYTLPRELSSGIVTPLTHGKRRPKSFRRLFRSQEGIS